MEKLCSKECTPPVWCGVYNGDETSCLNAYIKRMPGGVADGTYSPCEYSPDDPEQYKPEDGFDTFAPEHIAPLVGYLASPASERSSGNVYVIWGRSIRVLERPGYVADFETEEHWTHERVDQALTPWLADRDPVRDSFVVPPA